VPDERADGVERAAADRFAGEDAEPRLDHVEPGGALRGEVELDLGSGAAATPDELRALWTALAEDRNTIGSGAR
jgi:hypothetical protein